MKISNEALVSKLTKILEENESWQDEVFNSHNVECGDGFNENYTLDSLTVMVESDEVSVLVDFSNEYRNCSGEEEDSDELFPGADQVKLSLGSVDSVLESLSGKTTLEMSYEGEQWAALALEGLDA